MFSLAPGRAKARMVRHNQVADLSEKRDDPVKAAGNVID